MNIVIESQDFTAERWIGWHILTVAEAGFSMLDIYGCHQNGLDKEAIRQFADRINERNEAASLHPKAPISALPCHFFREHEQSQDPAVLTEFKRQITEFLNVNQSAIHAQRVLVDFHVSSAPVSRRYVRATEEVFRLHDSGRLVQQVVIFT